MIFFLFLCVSVLLVWQKGKKKSRKRTRSKDTDVTHTVLVAPRTPSPREEGGLYGSFRMGWQHERFQLQSDDIAFAKAQIAAIAQKRLPGEKILWSRQGRTYRDDDLDTVATIGQEDEQVAKLITEQVPNDPQVRRPFQFGESIGGDWFDITVTATRVN